MNGAAGRRYEFRVDGHLDPHWGVRLGGLDLTHHCDGTSTLAGEVTDQTQLHGLLAGFRDIGAPLVSLCRIDDTDDAGAAAAASPLRQRLDWPRRTERLSLRPGRAADAAAVWRYRRLEPVARWLTAAPRTFEGFRADFESDAWLAPTLVIELAGEVIGDLMVRVEDGWAQAEVADRARGAQAELGWVLHPDHTGHGYATEALRELLRICFDGLRLRRVHAGCFADNEASWRLMERVGMRRELHARRESLHRSGEWLDGYGYALLAEEWRSAAEERDPTPDARSSARAR